jgi:hypothetical protein
MKDTEDIRKKEKKLNREHWMCRVQMYTFGIDAPNYYMGYCPFFWMTWVSMIALPIVFLGKTFVKLTSILIRPVTRYIDTRAKAREAELIKTPLEPTYSIILNMYAVFEKEDCVYGVTIADYCRDYCRLGYTNILSERITLWFLQNPNWRDTHLEKARAERQRVEGEERERRKKREARNRKLSNVAGLCGRGLFKLLIPTMIIALGALAYTGIIKLCSVVGLEDIVLVFSITGFIIAGFLACRILGDFLSTFVFTEHTKDKISRICDGLSNKICSVSEFIIDTVALTYKAECPLIVWGEETGNITRRDKSKNKQ